VRVLELFAGIGGLRLAAPPGFTIVAAYDQDAAAASTYEANHGERVTRVNLSAATAAGLERHEAEAWLLSPPCQPFTKRGRRRDVDDPRCAALLRLTGLLAHCRPRRLLLENVPGFHGSRMHAILTEKLRDLGHDLRDVTACPTELGAPLRRVRHFVVSSADGLGEMDPPAPLPDPPPALVDHLDPSPDPVLRIADEMRHRVEGRLHELGDEEPIGAFTSSYGRAITGAGPVLLDDEGPRWFSPEEILRLHGFPASFRFPEGLTLRTRWRLAGNSVHVGCVRRVASTLA
jgi:DNA (cytosine-5)-methyltransferase 1/tRNA (cytosine38-C5)-methyltransferase